MSRPHEKRDLVAEFIRSELEKFYNENNSRKIARKNTPQFNSKAKLIRHVLDSEFFIETKKLQAMTPIEKASVPEDRLAVSANTVRDAINQLLDEADIEIKDGYFVWRQKPSLDEKRFPILQIANQVEVTINVPEYTFFLTVPSEFSTAITNYLSEYFRKDDIIFFPMGRFIMCVSVLPESVLTGKEKKDTPNDIPYAHRTLERVASALHKFKLKYPSFTYNFPYEIADASYEKNPIRDALYTFTKNTAEKKSVENLLNPHTVGERFSETQDTLALVVDIMDQLEEAGRNDLLAIDDSDSSEKIDPETGLPYLDPETGLPYLEESEELSEKDMEIAASVWSHEDKIVDADIEQYLKDEANQKNAPTAAQEDESKKL